MHVGYSAFFFVNLVFYMSYHGLAFTFLALTGKVIGLSQPAVAVICWIKEVYVADEHLDVENNTQSPIFHIFLVSEICFNSYSLTF